MTGNKQSKSSSSRGASQPGGGAPGQKQRPGDRAAARNLSRAGTRSSGSSELGPVLGWTMVSVVIAAVVIGAAVLISQQSGNGSGAIAAPTVVTPSNIPTDGRTLGRSDAPVTVDIYGDFRCSACLVFTTGGTEQSLVDNYIATGKAKLVWHDRLIIDELSGGNTSRDAANAAFCAADQGKFWTMHDWLYANSSESSTVFTAARLSDIGKKAGLDMSKYQPCLDAGTHDAAIVAVNKVESATITSTPTLYVDGKVIGTAGRLTSYDQLKAAIDAELAKPAPTVAPSPSPTVAPSPSAAASP
jgi:protein-disulfide isomerase